MKIRSGFVSNSSSSSFVLLGAKIDKFKPNKAKMIKMMKKHGIKYDKEWVEDDFGTALSDGEFGGLQYLWEESIVGFMISTESDYIMDRTTTSVKDLAKKAKEVKKTIKEVFGEDVDVKLITGQYAC